LRAAGSAAARKGRETSRDVIRGSTAGRPLQVPLRDHASDRQPEMRHVRGAELSVESLRLSVGLFCGFIGAFFLVAPHRFTGPPYEHLLIFRSWLGGAVLAAGVGLLAVAVVRPQRSLRAAAHLAAGLALLGLAQGFARDHAWPGVIVYCVLGLGIAASAFRREPQRPARPAAPAGGDLFALLMGVIAALVGALVIVLPGATGNRLILDHREIVAALGCFMALSGSLLVHVELRRSPPRALVRTAHLATGAALVAFGIFAVVPEPSSTGIAFYWGCGLGLALLPWQRERLSAFDSAALGSRLALASVLATAVSLIVVVAVVTAQEERLGTEQALAVQQVEATAIARNVRDYVELNGARAAAVAAMAGRLPIEPRLQTALLERSLPLYRDAALLLTLDNAGKLIGAGVRTGGASGASGVRMPSAATLHDIAAGNSAPRAAPDALPVQLEVDRPLSDHARILLSAPVRGLDGGRLGVLVMGFDAAALAHRIERPGSIVTLADGFGTTIASRDDTGLPVDRNSRLATGWDHQFKSGSPPIPGQFLSSFAVVPSLGWVVAVERPHLTALAGITRGREVAFGLLLLVIPLAAAVGIAAAHHIARPLGTLADAVDELAAGNPSAPLQPSGITEVERLSAAFEVMRDRLAARTLESERLAAELRARADALAGSDRRKDEFLAMLAHELRNPLGVIATASYLLAQTEWPSPSAGRAVAIVQRQTQHLVRLVEDLLDMSRITRGKVELRREELDLVQIVQHAVETTRPILAARRHRLELDLPAAPLPLYADATRLEQVLSNLIRNAAKFTESGGLIELAVQSDGGPLAEVRVRDNGIGISPDLLPRIFDLFTQGDQGLDRSVGGLGIGLTLVRTLVEMHGGRVEARSEGVGKGSEFVVRLPLLAGTLHTVA
jgi:signal transduction histidine kinase